MRGREGPDVWSVQCCHEHAHVASGQPHLAMANSTTLSTRTLACLPTNPDYLYDLYSKIDLSLPLAA